MWGRVCRGDAVGRARGMEEEERALLAGAASTGTLVLAGRGLQVVPEEALRPLAEALTALDLSSNALDDFTLRVTELPHLATLRLDWNKLRVLPRALGALPALTELDCSYNMMAQVGVVCVCVCVCLCLCLHRQQALAALVLVLILVSL